MSETSLPKFLLDQINVIAVQKGFTNYKIKSDAGSNHGDGFMGILLRVKVCAGEETGNGKVHEIELICKSLPESVARRNLFSADKAFKREVYMYTKVLPYFVKFQSEKGLTKDSGFFQFPHCYFACSDDATNQHIIIMDDLRADGYQLWNKFKEFDIDNVNQIMEALGRFHAISFAIRDQHAEILQEFGAELNDVMLDMVENGKMKNMFKGSYDKNIQLFSGNEKILKFFKTASDTWLTDFHECLDPNVAEPYSVIGHGDCWINNFLFKKV